MQLSSSRIFLLWYNKDSVKIWEHYEVLQYSEEYQ